MIRSAIISPCGLYRNRLIRRWAESGPIMLLLGLNPSTADGETDDPTNRRVVSFAQRELCAAVIMENLFPFRATNPKDMMAATDPAGPDNMDWILRAANDARESGGPIVAAWGAHGGHMNQDMRVLSALLQDGHKIMCFGVTRGGHPKHPLYLRADTPLEQFVVEW